MNYRVINVEQNSPEWYEARLGRPTASSFQDVMAEGRKKGEPSLTRARLMAELAYEIDSGKPYPQKYTNPHMERGHEMEQWPIDLYELQYDVVVEKVGFLQGIDVWTGASPDGLVGEDGLVEVKSKLPHLMIDLWDKRQDTPPPEHMKQIQGQLWVSGRAWCDLLCYYEGWPVKRFRIERDDYMISEIAAAVDQFNHELFALVERKKQWRDFE